MLITLRKGTVTVEDKTDWSNKTEALYHYLRRDHRVTLDVLQDMFPDTWDQRTIRVVPFVQRLARSLATLYQRRPTREFLVNGVPPEALNRAADSMYKMIGFDDKMQSVHEQLVAMNNATLWVWPDNRGGVRLMCIPVHDQEFKLAVPYGDDVEDLEAAWVQLPIAKDPASGIVTHGIAKITKDTAVWEDGPKGMIGQPLWGDSPVNPLGRVPVVMLRGSEPSPGEWFAPVPQDLLYAQLALDLTYTDIGHIASLQGYGQPVITGVGAAAATELKLGPESVIGLPDPEMSFDFRHGNPPLAEYQQAADQYLRSVLAFVGVNPDVFLKTSGAISSVAKRMDMHERDIERARHAKMFEKAEQQAWDLIRLWSNELRGAGASVYPETEVRVSYHQADPPMDELHREQAVRMALDAGLTSPAKELARREGIPEREAKMQVQENLRAWQQMQAIVAPDSRVTQGRAPTTEGIAEIPKKPGQVA